MEKVKNMMSAADEAIVARDSVLPGLSLLLDPSALAVKLRALPALCAIRSVTLEYLRYKPGTSCVAGLILHMEGGERKRYFAKAMPPERFWVSWQHPKRQALVAAGDATAPLALQDESIMLSHPLRDRDIRHLVILQEEKKRNALFRRWLQEVSPGDVFEWRALRYKPERRFVAKISSNAHPLAVLRCANAKEFGRILQGTAVGMALGHVELLGASAEYRMLATRWIAGECLGPEESGRCDISAMEEVGQVLAQVHNAAFALPVPRTAQDNTQAMWRVLNTLSVIYPQVSATFTTMAALIAQHMSRAAIPSVIIHGDFSADQVIRTENDGTLRIIDWDRSAYGNPLTDLASFQARLELQVIEGIVTREEADAALVACLRGYSTQRKLSLATLPWYSAWALLCLATEPFRKRTPGWDKQIETLLTRAAQWIASVSEPVAASDETLVKLQNVSLMAEPLNGVLALPEGSMLSDCTLIRHKPGRRALLDYHFTLSGTAEEINVLGKYGVKGADRRSFINQMTLWQNGFNQGSDVSVPEPLALLPDYHLWLQRKVKARSLAAFLTEESELLERLGGRVAIALTKVHHSGALQEVIGHRYWHISDEMTVLQRRLKEAAALRPQWEKRILLVLDACEKLSVQLVSEKNVSLHRDFYFDQVMVCHQDPQRLILLDFDLCCMGAAALDAGNYLAHVRELALRLRGDVTRFASHEQAFTHVFLNTSDGVTPFAVEGYTTLSMARHIYLSTQFADRAHTTEILLSLCEQALQPWFD